MLLNSIVNICFDADHPLSIFFFIIIRIGKGASLHKNLIGSFNEAKCFSKKKVVFLVTSVAIFREIG